MGFCMGFGDRSGQYVNYLKLSKPLRVQMYRCSYRPGPPWANHPR